MKGEESCKCPLCNSPFTPADGLTADEYLTKNIIGLYKEMQRERRCPCPRCGRDSMSEHAARNAVSRAAEISICDECGTAEAAEESNGELKPVSQWKVIEEIMNLAKLRVTRT